MRILVAVASLMAITACATPYQDMGLLGGVRAVRITEDTAQITASGNAYTDPDVIDRYALRKASEETIQDGFDLFRIDTEADRTRVGAESFGSVSGNRYGAWGSAFTVPMVKPGQSLMIRMLHGPRPDPMPDGEYDAHEVLKYLAANDASSDHKNCVTGADGKVVCK